MMAVENRKVQMTKKILSDTLVSLLETHHMTQISVSLLCTEANINRTTFYKHYKSVLELLDEIEQNVLNYFYDTIKKLHIINSSFEAKFALESLFKYVKDRQAFFKSLLSNNNYNTFLEKLIKVIYEKVDDNYPISFNKTPEAFVYVIHGSIALVKLWVSRDFDHSTKHMTHLIIDYASKFF